MASAVLSLTNWNNLIECLHLVHVDSNHQAVIQQLFAQLDYNPQY